MANFAEVNDNNIVIAVHTVDDAAIIKSNKEDEETGKILMQSITKRNSQFIQTSYNTRGGKHYNSDGTLSWNKEKRKNYAGIGYSYNPTLDAFIPPKPFPSWVLDEKTCLWNAPKECPKIGDYYWDESKLNWIKSST